MSHSPSTIGLVLDAERLFTFLSPLGSGRVPPLPADFVLIGDVTGPDSALDVSAQLVASYAAARLDTVLLVPEIDVFRSDPYLVAREIASLDILSGGRAGFAPIGDAGRSLDVGYARTGVDSAYVAEFVAVVRTLWNSWLPGALARDWSTNRYVDAARIIPARFEGAYFSVAGPLPVPTPIQKAPPVFVADVDAHRELIADAYGVLAHGRPVAGAPGGIVLHEGVLTPDGAGDIPDDAAGILLTVDPSISDWNGLVSALGRARSAIGQGSGTRLNDIDERRVR